MIDLQNGENGENDGGERERGRRGRGEGSDDNTMKNLFL
jgi:hypothetical protein